jgi:hypothetical protein
MSQLEEHFRTGSKKGRGRAKRSLDLIEAMYEIAEAAHPITVRGVGYKLFVRKLIASMARSEVAKVSHFLTIAREEGTIPWPWIVDETRGLEQTASWRDPEAFIRNASNSYFRDFWKTQPVRVEVWSEKGTVRGLLRPILERYGVGFQVMHGFSGATTVHDVAISGGDGRKLIALYVGDYDPSGMFMSERDLPKRLERYGGDHVSLDRITLTKMDTDGLPSFPASDKTKDPRYKWFVANYGDTCWELDALDPNTLRSSVEAAILANIEAAEWERCVKAERAEQESIRSFFASWKGAA